MFLYLVRHGQPHPKEVDPERGLADKGFAEVKKVASFLDQRNLKVDVLWESGKKRATQTAEILASAVFSAQGKALQKAGIAPNDPVVPVAEELSTGSSDHMIVGHLPFLSRLASYLILGDQEPDVVSFQQGGLVCLQRDTDGKWTVGWMVVPALL